MSDIVDDLRACAQEGESASNGGLAEAGWKAKAVGLLRDAAIAILGHRAIAGVITPDDSLATIKESLRTPEGIARLKSMSEVEALPHG